MLYLLSISSSTITQFSAASQVGAWALTCAVVTSGSRVLKHRAQNFSATALRAE
jgi:hypothetical protein